MSDWKPATYPSVSPYLICADAEAVIDFMITVFGGTVLRRIDRPDGTIMHAEVRIDDSVVMIGGATPSYPARAQQIHVYVRDVDAVFATAIEQGAAAIEAPQRKHDDDDRRGGFTDSAGNAWWIATQ
ncbi:extradiol dioxygenase [Aureimonas sp. SA4125]|uniref:VOC family protein n=1 Tax=Aureimonas sp. SA4125 TaxID=2826993 RepID=UPI001CC7C597|nr:VOC family protein [Aureimonas sp. SA4125]BDA83741.1 extradiol dioxygenase [Aureimonas sp. SA4125]